MLLGLIPFVLENYCSMFLRRERLRVLAWESSSDAENFHAKIFRRRHRIAKCRNLILQRAMIKRLDHSFVHKCIEIGKIRNHAGGGIDRAGEKLTSSM